MLRWAGSVSRRHSMEQRASQPTSRHATMVSRDQQGVDEHIMEEESDVQAFYRDATVFMTGATGFMGMVMLEKLLRSCPGLGRVYLLMRAKKGKDMHQRFKELLDDPLYSRMKKECPKYQEKVFPLEGDCSLPELGLNDADRATLRQEVHVVFHVAATVRFDEPLKTATAINVRGTRDVVILAKEMVHLKALVHVSTAYAHCRKTTDECFYPPLMTHDKLLALVDALDDKVLEKVTPAILGQSPNTYTFTKSIAEDTIRVEGKGLPVCVLRPSMVINTAEEPFSGWVNNLNGPTGAVVGSGLGILRTINMDLDIKADIVPVDLVSNATLVAAWDTARTSQKLTIEEADHEPKVFNYVSSARRPITWRTFMEINENGINYPSEHIMWYYCLFITKSWLLHSVQKIFLHLLPALLVDATAICIGKKPILLKAYKKIHKFLDVTAYFSGQEWIFLDNNVEKLWSTLSPQDKKMFPFDVASLNWHETISHLIPGLRVYFLKDPLDTLDKAKIRYRKLKWLHYSVVAALALLTLRLLWWTAMFFV